MSASISTTWDGLRRMAKEFHELAPSANRDELENGMKCFGIAYFGCEYPAGLMGQNQQQVQAPILLRIVGADYFQRLAQLGETS